MADEKGRTPPLAARRLHDRTHGGGGVDAGLVEQHRGARHAGLLGDGGHHGGLADARRVDAPAQHQPAPEAAAVECGGRLDALA